MRYPSATTPSPTGPGQTFSPTTSPTPVRFRVVSGGPFCVTSHDGRCVTDGLGAPYGSNEDCEIEVLATGLLYSTQFDTELRWDHLTVDGERYSGTAGPDGVMVTANETVISWHSDFSIQGPGWIVCWVGGTLLPMPSPPTVSPTGKPTASPATWYPSATPTTPSPTGPGQTFSPTTSPTPVRFRVVSGGPFCVTSHDGRCVTDGLGAPYGSNEDCEIEVLATGLLYSTQFDTELRWDHLTVDGERYSGTAGPDGVMVTANETVISWHSDYSIQHPGWTVCWVGGTLSPTTSPPTVSPTSPTVSPTSAPTASQPSQSPSQTPTEALRLDPACQQQLDHMASMTAGQTFFVEDTITIQGFHGRCDNRSSIFEGHAADNAPNSIEFGVRISGVAEGSHYGTCVGQQGGQTSIFLNSDFPEGEHIVEFYATATPQARRRGRSQQPRRENQQLVLASWPITVMPAGAFGLAGDDGGDNTTACGVASIRALQQRFAAEVTGRYDVGTMMVLPGVAANTAETGCHLDDVFVHFGKQGDDSSPAVDFSVRVDAVGTGATTRAGVAGLVDDVFYSRTGKLSITLATTGHFRVTLEAKSRGQTLDLTQFELDVRQTDIAGQTCNGHGTAVDNAAPQDDQFDCICDSGFVPTTSADGLASCAPAASPEASSAGDAAGTESHLSAYAVSAVAVALIVAMVCYYHWQKSKAHGPFDFAHNLNELDFLPDPDALAVLEGESHEYVLPLELPRSSVTLVTELGAGQFGLVHKGLFKPPRRQSLPMDTDSDRPLSRSMSVRSHNSISTATFEYAVAVKTLKRSDEADSEANADVRAPSWSAFRLFGTPYRPTCLGTPLPRAFWMPGPPTLHAW